MKAPLGPSYISSTSLGGTEATIVSVKVPGYFPYKEPKPAYITIRYNRKASSYRLLCWIVGSKDGKNYGCVLNKVDRVEIPHSKTFKLTPPKNLPPGDYYYLFRVYYSDKYWRPPDPNNLSLWKPVITKRYGFVVTKRVEACGPEDFKGKTVTVNVTDMMRKVGYSGSWYLIIHKEKVLGIERYGKTRPPARSPKEIVEGWRKGIEKQRLFCKKDGYYYWVTYPCELKGTAACGPEDFILSEDHHFDVTNTVRKVLGERVKRARLTVFKGKPIAVKFYGRERPPARSPEEMVEGWKKGIEIWRVRCSKDQGYYYVYRRCKLTIEYYECKASDFIGKPHTYDVTSKMNQAGYPGEWKLTVYYDRPISAKKYGPEVPPERSLQQMVEGWKKGIELVRMKCKKDGYYYWVTYPCKLEKIRGPEEEKEHREIEEHTGEREAIIEFEPPVGPGVTEEVVPVAPEEAPGPIRVVTWKDRIKKYKYHIAAGAGGAVVLGLLYKKYRRG